MSDRPSMRFGNDDLVLIADLLSISNEKLHLELLWNQGKPGYCDALRRTIERSADLRERIEAR